MTGWKTWLGGIGSIVYGIVVEGIYNQNYSAAMTYILAGISILGIGHKIEKSTKY